MATNYLELNMGLDLVLVANMLVLLKDKVVVVVADAGAGVAAGDDANVVYDDGDDGHLWSDLWAVRWVWLMICLALFALW